MCPAPRIRKFIPKKKSGSIFTEHGSVTFVILAFEASQLGIDALNPHNGYAQRLSFGIIPCRATNLQYMVALRRYRNGMSGSSRRGTVRNVKKLLDRGNNDLHTTI